MRKLLEFRRGLRVAGHPLHTMLVHFPAAFLGVVLPLEAAGAAGWDLGWRLAYYAEAAGLAAGVFAAMAGLPDLIALAKAPKEAALANLHMMAMAGALGFFGVGFFLRQGPGPVSGTDLIVTLALSFLGASFLVWGGWLGGELVYTHGVGREDRA